MSAVELRDISRRYGAALAVDRVSLTVAPGELLALLGPSGCGKTTTLRMVAGFVPPSDGTILLAGKDVTRIPAHRRDTGMVFQSYALFPHLTVAQNIEFGLRRRGVHSAERRDRVARMVSLLRLTGLEARLPRELSGGQQQRVAIGRSLVINPTVLLLDEPFSNLDALLREGTRVELRRLQQELRITTLFVTHDQAEAMAISDRIAVMNAGRIEQVATPEELYRRPASRFVAGFVGRANLRDGAGGTRVIRPEQVALSAGKHDSEHAVTGTVEVASFLGPVAQLTLRLADGSVFLAEGGGDLPTRFPPGSAVTARWQPDETVIVPEERA